MLTRRSLLALSCLAVPLSGDAALAAPVAEGGGPSATTVAVLYFDYSGKNQDLMPLQKGLAQMLITDLAAVETLRVVERERLQAILDEHKLATSGKIDSKTAARIGKLLGARHLVLGSYFDVAGSLRVDARLVDVETGAIVKSIGAQGKADEFLELEQKLADGLRVACATLGRDKPVRGGAAVVPVVAPRKAPKAPKHLKTETAVTYGRALLAYDAGDKPAARKLFRNVLDAQPDFELAQRDLDRLIQ
jgi:TolB-like protein